MGKKNKTKKGFTLIELLMVVSIIGILSSIILVNLGGVKNKAKDAAIMASANSMMKAMMVEISNNNYSSYKPSITSNGWISYHYNCSDRFSAKPNGANLVVACNKILQYNPEMEASSDLSLYATGNPSGGDVYVDYSIMAALPGVGTYYCIGSNGRTSRWMGLNGENCGATNWSCPGCVLDTQK